MFKPEIKSKPNEDISILVKLDNHSWNYLCECGDASKLTVKEIQNTNAIFISHTHIDHFVNFDAVIRHQIGIQRKVIICGPKDIQMHVQAKLKSYTWNLIEKDAITYEIREVISDQNINCYLIEPPFWELKEIDTIDGNTIFKEKGFEVNSVLLDHKTPVLAYKFKANDTVKINLAKSDFKGGKWIEELKQAFQNQKEGVLIRVEEQDYKAKDLFHLLHVEKGDSLGIIMDHAANSENHLKIQEHFFKCDKVFVESFYKEEDKEFAETNYHSFSSKSGEIMKKTKVRDAVPVHFSRKYDQEDIDQIIKEFNLKFLAT